MSVDPLLSSSITTITKVTGQVADRVGELSEFVFSGVKLHRFLHESDLIPPRGQRVIYLDIDMTTAVLTVGGAWLFAERVTRRAAAFGEEDQNYLVIATGQIVETGDGNTKSTDPQIGAIGILLEGSLQYERGFQLNGNMLGTATKADLTEEALYSILRSQRGRMEKREKFTKSVDNGRSR